MTSLETNTELFRDFLPHCQYVKFLGEGAFAKVYLIHDSKDNLQLAVKKVILLTFFRYPASVCASTKSRA